MRGKLNQRSRVGHNKHIINSHLQIRKDEGTQLAEPLVLLLATDVRWQEHATPSWCKDSPGNNVSLLKQIAITSPALSLLKGSQHPGHSTQYFDV